MDIAWDHGHVKIEADGPVLVDFWAQWCAPCHMVAPAVERVAETYAGKATVGKLNVDEHPEIAGEFGIRSIPTLLVFKGGQVVDGLGTPRYRADVGVSEGKIRAVGQLDGAGAARTVDCVDDVPCRDATDLVLSRTAAEEDHEFGDGFAR